MAEKASVQRKIPVRKCIGCDEMLGKKGLLRIVRIRDKEDGSFRTEIDLTGKKSGRGAYICRDAECFKAARKRKSLERALKCAISDEIYNSLLGEIENIKE